MELYPSPINIFLTNECEFHCVLIIKVIIMADKNDSALKKYCITSDSALYARYIKVFWVLPTPSNAHLRIQNVPCTVEISVLSSFSIKEKNEAFCLNFQAVNVSSKLFTSTHCRVFQHHLRPDRLALLEAEISFAYSASTALFCSMNRRLIPLANRWRIVCYRRHSSTFPGTTSSSQRVPVGFWNVTGTLSHSW